MRVVSLQNAGIYRSSSGRDGTWLYRGSSIERKELVCLFASVLRRDADGDWWLRTPAEQRSDCRVEDAPFVAVELDWGVWDGPTANAVIPNEYRPGRDGRR